MKRNGWPDTKQQVAIEARLYWTFSDKVATADGLLFKGTRLTIPKVMRPERPCQIHKSHLGIAKCRQRAREVILWPGMSLDEEQMVSNCSLCADFGKTQPIKGANETHCTTITSLAEDRNWSVWILRGTLFTLCVLLQPVPTSYQDGVFEKQCVVVEELTRQLESMGSQHKWSQMLTPNSAAVNSKNLQKSTVSSMSSVRPITQSLTERRREPFRLSKKLWRKNSEKHLASLNYWMTPLLGIELLPAQLLMGHWLRNELPTMDSLIQLASVNQKDVSMYLNQRGSEEVPWPTC